MNKNGNLCTKIGYFLCGVIFFPLMITSNRFLCLIDQARRYLDSVRRLLLEENHAKCEYLYLYTENILNKKKKNYDKVNSN